MMSSNIRLNSHVRKNHTSNHLGSQTCSIKVSVDQRGRLLSIFPALILHRMLLLRVAARCTIDRVDSVHAVLLSPCHCFSRRRRKIYYRCLARQAWNMRSFHLAQPYPHNTVPLKAIPNQHAEKIEHDDYSSRQVYSSARPAGYDEEDVFGNEESHDIRYKTLSWPMVAVLMIAEIVSNGMIVSASTSSKILKRS